MYGLSHPQDKKTRPVSMVHISLNQGLQVPLPALGRTIYSRTCPLQKVNYKTAATRQNQNGDLINMSDGSINSYDSYDSRNIDKRRNGPTQKKHMFSFHFLTSISLLNGNILDIFIGDNQAILCVVLENVTTSCSLPRKKNSNLNQYISTLITRNNHLIIRMNKKMHL